MAKKSVIERNDKRKRLAKRFAAKRARLKAALRDTKRPAQERFLTAIALAELPRNSAPSRVRNRCILTGRGRATYRKTRLSRIVLRELASQGHIPGMTKASW